MPEIAKNSVFNYAYYVDFLRASVRAQSAFGLSQAALARAMDCQPAYFSQVLKERVQLTEDHAIKLAEFLGLNENETDYWLILLRHAKASTPELRRFLESQRQKHLSRRTELEHRLKVKSKELEEELALYYCSDWVPGAIHMATSCKSFQTVESLSQRFSLPQQLVSKHLFELQRLGLVKFKNNRWIYGDHSVHFSKNSLLDPTYQRTRRLLAMNSVSNREPEDFHYSVFFATNPMTRKQLRQMALDFVEQFHKKVEPTDSEEVFSLNLDLFRI